MAVSKVFRALEEKVCGLGNTRKVSRGKEWDGYKDIGYQTENRRQYVLLYDRTNFVKIRVSLPFHVVSKVSNLWTQAAISDANNSYGAYIKVESENEINSVMPVIEEAHRRHIKGLAKMEVEEVPANDMTIAELHKEMNDRFIELFESLDLILNRLPPRN